MARSVSQRSNYIADPEKRAYHQAIRLIRTQVYHEYEKQLAETGFLKRLFLEIRIAREIRRRCREVPVPRKR